MHFDPVKVSLVDFAIVLKIHSAHCVSNSLNRHLLAKKWIFEEDTVATIDYEKLMTLWTNFGKFMTLNLNPLQSPCTNCISLKIFLLSVKIDGKFLFIHVGLSGA